ncbi:MAG: hypothetical protein HY741_24290 [Chloroflexi bacterium]|nr:hypothetical protein [Chloroflexota bacterium]
MRLLLITLAVVLALGLRLRAVQMLPVDYDEDDYLRAAQQYAAAIQHGEWNAFTELNYRSEHPPLSKIVYGVAIAPLKPVPEIPDQPTTASPALRLPQPHLLFARLSGAFFGVLTALALALLNPLAGILLALNTWTIKYSSQVMLEAIPAFTSLACVLAYMKSQRRDLFWLALSGILLGLTAASKYMYCVAGVAVLADWLWQEKSARGSWRNALTARHVEGTETSRSAAQDLSGVCHIERSEISRSARYDSSPLTRTAWIGRIALWGALALLFFALADPYLWHDPFNRLRESLFYHGDYASSQAVRDAGFPMWQPFVWLFGSVPWHPGVFLFTFDLFVTVFAFFGLQRLWQKYRVMALWLAFMLAFLLVWPTKWPQYILTVTAPVSLAAALGIQATLLEPIAYRVSRIANRVSRIACRVSHDRPTIRPTDVPPERLYVKPATSNFQFPISNLQFPISNFQFPTSNLQSPISNL